MIWEADLIAFLQNASNPFLDFIFLALTLIGDELFFLAIAVLIYWCVNKRFAFKLVNVYFLGAAVVEALKFGFARVRPFARYEDSVRSIGEETHGFSFPSGHSNSIANLSAQGYINCRKTEYKNTALIVGIVFTFIVMFSRVYLGQHYLTDVLTGASIGIGCAVLFSFLYGFLKDNEHLLFIGIVPLCIVILIILFATGAADNAPSVVQVLGAYPAFTIGYYIEKKYIKYDVKSDKFYKQILKLIIGLGIVFAIKEGLKFIFPADIILLYGFLRYFLLAAWASAGAMITFKLLKL